MVSCVPSLDSHVKPHHLPVGRVAVFALAWMLISQLMMTIIDWMHPVSPGQPFYNFRDYDLRYFIPAELMTGVLLGWLLFALLSRARTKLVRSVTLLSCLCAIPLSFGATTLGGFWAWSKYRVILMVCCGFSAAAIVIVAGFGLVKGLHWAFTRTRIS
jgi:hypothetical protein